MSYPRKIVSISSCFCPRLHTGGRWKSGFVSMRALIPHTDRIGHGFLLMSTARLLTDHRGCQAGPTRLLTVSPLRNLERGTLAFGHSPSPYGRPCPVHRPEGPPRFLASR